MTAIFSSINNVFDDPEQVLEIVRETADAEIVPRFKRLADADIQEKKPGDLVTAADLASEEALTKRLSDLLPGSVCVGEEAFEADPGILAAIGGDDPVWIIDPVDGTHNFAHGRMPFTVIVALSHRGVTIGGWIFDPCTREAVFALYEKGVYFERDRDVKVWQRPTKKMTLNAAVMTAGDKLQTRLERASADEGHSLPTLIRRYRCTGREYMDIAIGRLDAARYGGRVKPWDHAAGCLIVREAGGVAATLESDTPYEPTETIQGAPIGVVGNAALWPDFHRLARASDRQMA